MDSRAQEYLRLTNQPSYVYTIRVRKEPGEWRPKKARQRGKTTRLGLFDYMAILFEANETVPKDKRMTDKEVLGQVLYEFPANTSVKKRGVAFYRSLYNTGRLMGCMPAKPSRRYDDYGDVVSSRRGRPRLPDDLRLKRAARSKRKKS